MCSPIPHSPLRLTTLTSAMLPSWSLQVFFSSVASSGASVVCCDNDDVALLPGARGSSPCGLCVPLPSVLFHLMWMVLSFWSTKVFFVSVFTKYFFRSGARRSSPCRLFSRRSDTDMLRSACFELKTKGYRDIHSSKRNNLWRAPTCVLGVLWLFLCEVTTSRIQHPRLC